MSAMQAAALFRGKMRPFVMGAFRLGYSRTIRQVVRIQNRPVDILIARQLVDLRSVQARDNNAYGDLALSPPPHESAD